MRAAPTVALVIAFCVGCGARTGARVRGGEADAGAHDAGRRRDAGPLRDGGPARDGGLDAGLLPCPRCDDGVFCNGAEGCAADGSCIPGLAPDCDDGEPCTLDRCDPARDVCEHVPVERDDDGDGVSACGGDCDDRDPRRARGLLEICDGIDQDCDGALDEGVRSPCDDCRLGCRRIVVPDETEAMRWDLDDAAGVDVGPDGDLRLSTTRTETHVAWVANYLYGTVTRIDTRDGRQVAEYDSVLRDGRNGAAPPGQECEVERPGGNCPSRTAVDLRGAVYVANRAFFGQGTVTKIAGHESDCVDRDGDGTIDTSRDLDGDGVIEREVPGEFLGQRDECILWTVDVGGVDGVPRAIAIDGAGTVWVGLHNERRAVQLDPTDGRVLRSVMLPRTATGGFRPYGAAADGRGSVWMVEVATGNIVGIDTASGRVHTHAVPTSRAVGCRPTIDARFIGYGIAVDARDRVWIAGFLCPAVFRYDPDTDTWREFALPDSGVTRGIAAGADGSIYVASSHDWMRLRADGTVDASDPVARVTVVDGEDGRVVRIFGTASAPLPGAGTTGVGLDSSGFVWLVNQDSSTATRLDPRTGAAREFPTGIAPYTYSDFTGYALRTFTAPNGYVRTIVAGCAVGPTEWEQVLWNASVPAGTRLELRVRTADRVADLAGATWVGPFVERPTDLMRAPGPVGTGRYLELELQLFSDGGAGTPSVDDLTLQYNCP